MNPYWKTTLSAVAIASSLALTALPAWAAGGADAPQDLAVQAVAARQSYAITDVTKTQVKNVLLEKTSDGWRIGAVVKLYNESGSAVRIPSFELRAKAADGTTYTLAPSAANARQIPPQSSVDLSYMAEIESQADVTLTDLLWVDVDLKVYPKRETVLAEENIESLVWHGTDTVIPDASLLAWGEPFALPDKESALTYSGASLTTQFTGQSPTYIVQLKVENKGSYAEPVPDFTLSGKTDSKSFVGKRLEQTPVTLHPGESQYIHYAITTEPGAHPVAFYVLTPESFLKQGQQTPFTYYTGRIGFRLPDADAAAGASSLPPYEIGSAIAIDALSQSVSSDISVSVVGVDWFENESRSYKTAVVKIRYKNNGMTSQPLPGLGADLVNSQGVAYDGTPVPTAVKEIPSGMAALSELTFAVPLSETAERYTLRLLEQQGQGQQTYKSPVAWLNVAVRQPQPQTAASGQLSFYPYELKLKDWDLNQVASLSSATHLYSFSYKVKLVLDIQTPDEVVTDAANPRLYMQISNGSSDRVGYKYLSLSGTDNRLLNGNQIITFDNMTVDEVQDPVSLSIYETVSTSLGEAKRLLAVLSH